MSRWPRAQRGATSWQGPLGSWRLEPRRSSARWTDSSVRLQSPHGMRPQMPRMTDAPQNPRGEPVCPTSES